MFEEDDLISLSALQHVVFCSRRAALVFLEGAWEDSSATVEGSIFHGRTHEVGTESRGDVRIARGVRLRSLRLGLTGQTDVVEFHRLSESEILPGHEGRYAQGIPLEGQSGLWKVFPVEYKVGRLRSERAYEVQLCGQAICLEEMLEVEVPSGAIFFGKTVRRFDVSFDGSLRKQTEAAAQELLHEILSGRSTPKARYEKKCKECSLLEVCLPKVTGSRRNVTSYVEKSVVDLGSGDP